MAQPSSILPFGTPLLTMQPPSKELHHWQGLFSIFGHAIVSFLPLVVYNVLKGFLCALHVLARCYEPFGAAEEQYGSLDLRTVHNHRGRWNSSTNRDYAAEFAVKRPCDGESSHTSLT